MGLVQSKNIDQQVYKVGCLGKINDYKNSPDGRVLINLVGVTRFEVLDEVTNSKSYREFKVSYKTFDSNLQERVEKISTEGVLLKAKTFFKRNGLLLNWKEFEKLDETQKINTLAMIAPITNEEKQKLLESVSLQDKIKNLDNIINFYLHEIGFGNQTVQ